MAESMRLVDLIQAELDDFLSQRKAQFATISADLTPLIDYSSDLLGSGKRFRALFCYWGWQAVSGLGGSFDLVSDDVPDDLPAVVAAAAALELFHAAALVHDDIIDNSDTRRGRPAVHKRFQHLHRESGWNGSGLRFGQSAAVLLGDLLLGWSDELFDTALSRLSDRSSARLARFEFTRMRTEVTAGQYLDILEERSWQGRPETELLSRAHRVIVYKSAKYSVEAPLVIGGALGKAGADQLSSLREFGLPLGIAYQLRDDLLGVFGDPQLTGKPAGDDLREGKRTMLIAVARTKLPPNAKRLLDELLGDRDLTAQQVAMLQASIRQSGAVEHIERIIDRNVDLAIAAIGNARITAIAKEQLARLTETVIRRSA